MVPTRKTHIGILQAACTALLLCCAMAAQAQITFSYQGQLQHNGSPFNGSVALAFQLFDAATAGNQLGGDTVISNVAVVDGLFQVDVALGSLSAWNHNRWIQVVVDPGGPDQQVLQPRQRVRPVPVAHLSRGGTSDPGSWIVRNTGGQNTFSVYDSGLSSFGNVAPRQQLSIGSGLDLYSGTPNSPSVASIRGNSNTGSLNLNAAGSGVLFLNNDSGSGGVRFYNGTSSGEIMRLTPEGRLGINTAPHTSLHLDVAGGARAADLFLTNSGTVVGDELCRASSSNPAGVIGRCGASSRHLKDGIKPLAGASALVAALQPVRFAWKEGGQTDIGLIAEEFAEVIPELARFDDGGEVAGINYRHLTAVLIGAWQEQQTEIGLAQAELATHQARIAALQAELQVERNETAARLAALEALLTDVPWIAGRAR